MERDGTKLIECPEGNDACLKIDLADRTLKGCAKFSEVSASRNSRHVENVCLTDISNELHKVLRETVNADESFHIKRICECYQSWWSPDGCNEGFRKEGNLYPLVIIAFFTMKVFLF